MKKIALLLVGLATGVGYYLYKKTTKKEETVEEPFNVEPLIEDNNDYVVYDDSDPQNASGDGMFV